MPKKKPKAGKERKSKEHPVRPEPSSALDDQRPVEADENFEHILRRLVAGRYSRKREVI